MQVVICRYDRSRDLPRLMPVTPEVLEDASLEGDRKIIALIEQTCRAERIRGLRRHWTYDLPRHAHLLEVLGIERARLAERERVKEALELSIEMEPV